MKKVIFGALFLAAVGIGVLSCQKEELKISTSQKEETNSNVISTSKAANGNVFYSEEQRSYTWVEENTKLDCSSAGKGCTVKSSYWEGNEETDVTLRQLLALIDASNQTGDVNLNEKDLSYEFPELYKEEVITKINSGKLSLLFEFPYLKVLNTDSSIDKIYNYEMVAYQTEVISKLRANGGGFSKLISVNTNPGEGPWQCIESGNNCKVSKISFDLNWASSNLNYSMFQEDNNEPIIDVLKDDVTNRILVRTESGMEYGLEL